MPSKLFLWAKALVFTLVAPGTVLGLIPGVIIADGRGRVPATIGPGEVLALALIAGGVGLYASCLRLFVLVGGGTPAPVDPPSAMVAVGPYRFVRNPMYVGVVTALVGEALLFRSAVVAVYAAVVWAAFHAFVILVEEPGLRARFGESYQRYLMEVPRWAPRGPNDRLG